MRFEIRFLYSLKLSYFYLTEPIYLRSDRYLIPNEYVNLFLNIDSNQLRFSIDNETVLAEEFNPNDSINDLRLHTPLYVGGYDKKLIILPENVVVRNGFHGCISKVRIFVLVYLVYILLIKKRKFSNIFFL